MHKKKSKSKHQLLGKNYKANMNRVKNGSIRRKRHKKVIKFAKGFVGAHSRLFKVVNQQSMRALRYSYFDRKKRKNKNRRIWITRISAAVRIIGGKYNQVIKFTRRFAVGVNRKIVEGLITYDFDKTFPPFLI